MHYLASILSLPTPTVFANSAQRRDIVLTPVTVKGWLMEGTFSTVGAVIIYCKYPKGLLHYLISGEDLEKSPVKKLQKTWSYIVRQSHSHLKYIIKKIINTKFLIYENKKLHFKIIIIIIIINTRCTQHSNEQEIIILII